jgi:etoposide-induced protein 2.4 (EI24)
MKDVVDAFWRAAAYCLHPRVIVLSLAPLVIAAGVALALGWLFWSDAVAWVRTTIEGWWWVDAIARWFDAVGPGGFSGMLAPLVVVAVAAPVIVVVSLLLVALLMAPALTSLVARRRFPALERKHGASFVASTAWSIGCTLAALVALVVSMPLWFVPPLVMVLPPLIWGWLTWRVMAFDALADHASAAERRAVLREHHWPLFGIGIVTGYLGAAPSLVWAFGALTVVFAPLLIVVSIWLYTLVFAFSALWFAHYTLAALQRHRAASVIDPMLVTVEEVPPKPPLLR